MPFITLRLRLTAAVFTLAAVTGSAFLVSSAPAQQAKPKSTSVVGIWKVRTTATISDREVPYQNIYRFNSNKTGLYRIDIGKGPGRPEDYPEFHVACPFTWLEAADTIIINLPSGGADRVNERQAAIVSPNGQALQITKSQWQLKLRSGSSWKLSEMRTDLGGLRLLRQSAQPKASAGTTVFVLGNVRIHAALIHGTTELQMLTPPVYSGGSEPRYAKPVGAGEASPLPVQQVAGEPALAASTVQGQDAVKRRAQFIKEITKFRDRTQVQLTDDQRVLTQYEQGFQVELHQALPQADAATLMKASNLESGLGGLDASMQFIQQEVTHYVEKHKHYASPAIAKKYAQANQRNQDLIRVRQAEIRPLLAEEAHLFPATAESQRHLAQIHTFAIKAHNREINVAVDTAQLHVVNQTIQKH